MKIYVRKLLEHDITHEISITTDIVKNFFDSKETFNMIGKNSQEKGEIKINNVTDPRLGGDFKSLLNKEGSVNVNDIVLILKKRDNYILELITKKDFRYEIYFNMFTGNERHLVFYLDSQENDMTSPRITGGYNKIVYGVPGCGKSYHVNNNIIEKDQHKGNIYRTTFYPDYTNGDFVGQIIPKINKNDETSVLYDIQFGPFTEALLNAILNPSKNTYLIIEEINRGNASAIFGDLFQSLDRDDYGTSEYPIKNYVISTYLHKVIDNKYSVDFDLDNIRIPSNLIIIGTMNTSDQNVFTLDTAFKRRWKMKYIKNDVDNCVFAHNHIPNSNVTWAEFVKEINNYITSNNGLNINGEDKQIGSYFISSSEWNEIIHTNDSKIAARIFAEKVLSYLWDDVAKINRDAWFDIDKYRTLESLLSAFTEKGLEVFGDNISFTRAQTETMEE